MKGIQGLIVAIGLGVAGALLNFLYLTSKAGNLKPIGFIGIGPDVRVARGSPIRADHLVRVDVPGELARNLEKFAVKYSEVSTVVGQKALRTLEGGSLLMRDDLRTPPAELDFTENLPPDVEEVARGIPIDSRSIVPSLIEPGNLVSFLAPRVPAESPTVAAPLPPGGSEPGKPELLRPIPSPGPGGAAGAADFEPVGPFRVLSVGSRVGRRDVFQAAGLPTAQENVLVIALRLRNKKLEEPGPKLERLLQTVNFRPLSVLLHAPATKKE
jgi:hypothetical protein